MNKEQNPSLYAMVNSRLDATLKWLCSKTEEGPPPVTPRPAPVTAKDRDYLKMMYEQNYEHARQHEMLRAAATGFFIALIAGLLAATSLEREPSKDKLIGWTIFVLSMLGLLLNAKLYERYQRHREIYRGFRDSLELGLSPGLKQIRKDCDKSHEQQHPRLACIGLHNLWSAVYVITLIVGLVLAIKPSVSYFANID
jgi:hypothetical protein